MKLRRLQIERFKNLRNCEVLFDQPHLLNAFIGSNGSGKSNLIEALLQILIDVYFGKEPLTDGELPPCDFLLSYETNHRQITIGRRTGRIEASLDGEPISYKHLVARVRNTADQLVYPDTIFAYYSGDCERVRRAVRRYQAYFRRIVQKPESDDLSPLFVLSTNQQARNILLALIAHRHLEFLDRLEIAGAFAIEIEVQSPKGYDPKRDEPVLWGTAGKVRKILAALTEMADLERTNRVDLPIFENGEAVDYSFSETRIYTYEEKVDSESKLHRLAERLQRGGDNLYVALEHLAARGILKRVEYTIIKKDLGRTFDFDQLSEGEKQLIAVIGAIRLTNKRHNLVLLDEPDTHLNPEWSWEYPEMLNEAFDGFQREHSTVLMATHDPVLISGMMREQVFIANESEQEGFRFRHPVRHPRGQGVANLLCSSEFFGLPSSLDKETQKLLDERLTISIKPQLTAQDKTRLKALNEQLEILPGVSERDPDYVAFLRQRHSANQTRP